MLCTPSASYVARLTLIPFQAPSPRRSAFPQIVNGHGKRPEWIASRIRELLEEQGRALVTEMDPSDYATIRKTVPGVVYHAGAKTLRIDGEEEAREKLPGTVGIISDISIPAAAMEQLHIMAEFLGCYTFQIPSLSVTCLSDIVERMKSPSGIEFRTGTRGSDAFARF